MNETSVISERAWRGVSISILLVAAILRLFWLDLKPLHHDEGVNGFFLARLLREGVYQYDPANYHGPTLYYLTLPFAALLGVGTFTVRLVTVLSGTGSIWLILLLRRRTGEVGALAAAALIAVSPGAVYLSRYFIHEALFLFSRSALSLRPSASATEGGGAICCSPLCPRRFSLRRRRRPLSPPGCSSSQQCWRGALCGRTGCALKSRESRTVKRLVKGGEARHPFASQGAKRWPSG